MELSITILKFRFDRENTITEDEVKAFLKEAEETEDDGTAEAPAVI